LGGPLRRATEYLFLAAGSGAIAASFNLFLNPNRVASGGVIGVSTVVEHRWGLEPAWVQWGINVPLFLAGVRFLGGRFGVKTAVGSLLLPLFVLLTRGWPPLTDNPLLAAVYGGIGTGVGLGMVFRGDGSVGGFTLAARILHRHTGMSLGTAVLLLDGLVVLAAGVVFDLEKALYALIGLFVARKTIDVVQTGFAYSKVALIISKEAEAIRRAVLYDLERGLTRLSGSGGYSGEERTVLLVVVSQAEVTRLKALVQAADPDAFLILSDTTEVFGQGFKQRG
jgi:uncharacterized membrane-anchored protein YitT (DUF2179 family)